MNNFIKFLDKKIEEVREYTKEQGYNEAVLEQQLKEAIAKGKEEVIKVVPKLIETHEKMAYYDGVIEAYQYLKEVLEEAKQKEKK